MRIIAGQYRGRVLKTPRGLKIRPTLSRVRESLFNILASRIKNSCFLELYAGSGSVGLEALSRGSRQVVMVEADRLIARILSDNITRLDSRGTVAEIKVCSAWQAIEQLAGQKAKFDIIFLDPPYYKQAETKLWETEGRLDRLMAPQGLLILQHSSRESIPGRWAGCRKLRSRKYGETTLTFFEALPD
ncbi:16S rRNA (guanine(966)-N(2))-methyltransferase RsmD [bacterium]|nr:16S rRNA (guanine(966)-N(2))-methyltransferase RsmD [bacterium]